VTAQIPLALIYCAEQRTKSLTAEKPKNQPTTNYGEASSLEIWQVARAATAAPTYFKPLKVYVHPKDNTDPEYFYFIDGGFGHNNPTAVSIDEIYQLHGEKSLDMVVSVGTAKKEVKSKSLFPGVRAGRGGMAKLTDPETTHETVRRQAEKARFDYFRLNNPETLAIPLDEWKKTTLNDIRSNFKDWALEDQGLKELQRCASQLVEGRRSRVKEDPARWERYATGSHFFCPHSNCESDFMRRDDFESHVKNHEAYKKEKIDSEWIADHMSSWKYREGRTRPNAGQL
jgi:hypothetical protein